jgi:hypothetical protein
VRQTVIEEHLDRWLSEVERDVDTVQDLGLVGLLSSCGEIRNRLAKVVSLMEEYLIAHLDAVVPGETLPDGRKRFVVDLCHSPDTGWETAELVLPGCTDRVALERVFAWLASCRTAGLREQREQLVARMRTLYDKWDGLPNETARRWCREEMDSIQAKLDNLDQTLSLPRKHNEVLAELVAVQRAVSRARRESRNRQRAELVRGLLERIEVSFDYRRHGRQERSVWREIRFVPRDRLEPRTYTNAPFSNENPPGLILSAQGLDGLVARLLAYEYPIPA